ncbi:MAG TPA: hypothetical protein VGY54_00960 [Polyangiaceae bacterium]|jgi:hypothetical protein|nr:hypothetical protein [Polyangiaceae bacterium]
MPIRPDPRAEPEDEPVSDKRDVESQVQQPIVAPDVRKSAAPSPKNKASEDATPRTSFRPLQSKRPLPDRTSVTSVDPRLERIEPTIDEGNWQGVRTMLGSIEDAGSLPPTLGLIAAIAHSETAGEEGSPGANELAIRCMASLFAVGNDSPIGRVLAKRLLRKNPRTSPQQSAPQTRVPVAIFFVVLVAIGIAGWLAATGTIRIPH